MLRVQGLGAYLVDSPPVLFRPPCCTDWHCGWVSCSDVRTGTEVRGCGQGRRMDGREEREREEEDEEWRDQDSSAVLCRSRQYCRRLRAQLVCASVCKCVCCFSHRTESFLDALCPLSLRLVQ